MFLIKVSDKKDPSYLIIANNPKTCLLYTSEYRNGDITFSKGNETYTYPLNTLKLGNLGDNRESLLEQFKERIISFFDKNKLAIISKNIANIYEKTTMLQL